jgi:lipopolysaccharide transport system ATP-binding protein
MMTNITLSQASVEIPVFNSASRSLTNSLVRAATGGLLTTHKGGHVSIRALSEISFELRPGDRLGVIGHNGSGKSTLLRLLTGIYSPTSGAVSRSGTIASLMDISFGINQDNTGRENIFLRGKLMGLSKREIDEKIDEIVAFTELGAYINLPVRTYSSGMLLRLAFSVATSIRADIIIMDEWLSVGDEGFADRAQTRLNELVDESEILVIASHSRALIEKTCNRVLWLEHGLVKMLGGTKEVVDAYFGEPKLK